MLWDSFEKFARTILNSFPSWKALTIRIHWNWNESKLLFPTNKTINFLQAPFKPTERRVFDIVKRFWVEYHFKFYCPLKRHSPHCVFCEFYICTNWIWCFYWVAGWTWLPWKWDQFVQFHKWLTPSSAHKLLKLSEVSWASNNRKVRLYTHQWEHSYSCSVEEWCTCIILTVV